MTGSRAEENFRKDREEKRRLSFCHKIIPFRWKCLPEETQNIMKISGYVFPKNL
jgi:urocanate hydratase